MSIPMHKAAEIFVKLAKLPQFIPVDDQGHYLRNVLTGSECGKCDLGMLTASCSRGPGKAQAPSRIRW